uniref:Activator of basal transcription 1 n=1 Tax=Panagrellus redivivus TaxID=6233 RepID=A0A7E4VG68_PANRE
MAKPDVPTPAANPSPKLDGVKKKKKKTKKFATEKRDVRDIQVVKDKELRLEDIERELALDDDEVEKSKKTDPDAEQRQRRSGVVFFEKIPPGFNAARMRMELSKLAEINRIYLAPAISKKGAKTRVYKEGWVEFVSKRKAKFVAQMLNGNMVLGKNRRNRAYDTIWTCKYLHGFKWIHLMEQLVYEKKVEDQRMRAELSKVKRQAEFFADKIDKGARIKKLEERVLKKGGLWERFQRQVQQRKSIKEEGGKKYKQPAVEGDAKDFMKMIFDAKED